jgi:hypothetical protein
MKIKKSITINRNNNQGAIYLPSKVLKELQRESSLQTSPSKVIAEISFSFEKSKPKFKHK